MGPAKYPPTYPIRTVARFVLGSVFVTLAATACGQQNTARENVNAQNLADSQARYAELAPAEGLFEGNVHLPSSGKDYCMVVELQRSEDTARAPNSPNATDAVEVPKLAGNVRFPAAKDLSATALRGLSDLLDPMGGYASALVDFGDYNPKTRALVLPYSVPAYIQGNFGELNGVLNGDVFKGKWFSKPFGTVGTFELKRTAGAQDSCGAST